MSRFFSAAVCVLALAGPAAFAQSSVSNSMSNNMGNSMSNGNSMSHSTSGNSMAQPAGNMTPVDSMSKPGAMAPSSTADNAMSSPPGGAMSHSAP